MLLVLTTGGTIDKVYFDASSEYEVGEPTVPHVFRESGVTLEWRLLPLLRKDSLEMTGDDRAAIRQACADAPEEKILITHGTDTMALTAEALVGLPGKTIVLTGALAPASVNGVSTGVGWNAAAEATLRRTPFPASRSCGRKAWERRTTASQLSATSSARRARSCCSNGP